MSHHLEASSIAINELEDISCLDVDTGPEHCWNIDQLPDLSPTTYKTINWFLSWHPGPSFNFFHCRSLVQNTLEISEFSNYRCEFKDSLIFKDQILIFDSASRSMIPFMNRVLSYSCDDNQLLVSALCEYSYIQNKNHLFRARYSLQSGNIISLVRVDISTDVPVDSTAYFYDSKERIIYSVHFVNRFEKTQMAMIVGDTLRFSKAEYLLKDDTLFVRLKSNGETHKNRKSRKFVSDFLSIDTCYSPLNNSIVVTDSSKWQFCIEPVFFIVGTEVYYYNLEPQTPTRFQRAIRAVKCDKKYYYHFVIYLANTETL